MVCVAPEDCEFFYEYFWRQRLEDSEGKASKKPKSSHFPFKVDLSRQLTAEFVGTAWLVATVVGSGIGGDRVSSDDGVALLGNTLATLGCLYVLITIFVKVSEKNGAIHVHAWHTASLHPLDQDLLFSTRVEVVLIPVAHQELRVFIRVGECAAGPSSSDVGWSCLQFWWS